MPRREDSNEMPQNMVLLRNKKKYLITITEYSPYQEITNTICYLFVHAMPQLLFYISDDMIADMMKPEFRNYMNELSSGKYKVDLSKKPKEAEPVATYRKLNVD